MSQQHEEHITLLLKAAADGEEAAVGKLLPVVYDQLRAIARSRMRHVPPGNTLQPTALVHEAYARLVGPDGVDMEWATRGRFFAAAATAMRDILVEQARRKASLKAGGAQKREWSDPADHPTPDLEPPAEDMLALDAALRKLEAEDPRKAQVVMLKHFAGLETRHIAPALGVSIPTIDREWAFAKAWLKRELAAKGPGAP